MRSLLLTHYGLPVLPWQPLQAYRPTYPGCHRCGGMLVIDQSVGGGTGVLRLCPGTLAEGSLYDGLKEMCQEWCWLALCQSDITQLRKCPNVLAVASPWPFFLINYYCGKAQLTVDGAGPGQVVLYCIRRQSEQAKRSKSVSSSLLWPLLSFCSRFIPCLS